MSEQFPLLPYRMHALWARLARVLFASLFVVAFLPGCGPTPPPETHMFDRPNLNLLDEANRAGGWFHAKKTRPIWAKVVEQPQVVQTLEGEETVQPGHVLCRGEAGELWPQTAEQLARRYSPTAELDFGGWRKHLPHPDAQGVMAIQIPHAFHVIATWGKLSGKPGDYLLKNFQDRNEPYPDDVWIVDQKLFLATYAAEKSSP